MKEEKTIKVEYIKYDGVKFYHDKKGYWLGSVNKKAKRLHIYVWEKFNGPIPKGYHIHHIDHNTDNNEIENLQLMTQREHLSLHGQEEHNKAICKYNLNKYARPEAVKWHKSQECRDWGRENYKTSLAKVHEEKVEKVCECCGNSYITDGNSKTTSRFCSNKCKSKWRRDNHLDDVIKNCVICGTEFCSNKYDRTETCSRKCGIRLGVVRRGD